MKNLEFFSSLKKNNIKNGNLVKELYFLRSSTISFRKSTRDKNLKGFQPNLSVLSDTSWFKIKNSGVKPSGYRTQGKLSKDF